MNYGQIEFSNPQVRFVLVRPIGGNPFVFDRRTLLTKEIIGAAELDLWLCGSASQSHAQLLKAFYPNGEAPL
jgi:hypothetical protein